MSQRKIAKVFSLLKEGVEKGVFPGAVCGLSLAGERLSIACGYLAITPFSEPAEDHHLYDLASLTKPLAGALSLIHRLSVVERCFDLFKPLGEYLEGFDELSVSKARKLLKTPVYRLLNHTSGLKAWLPLYQHRPLTLVRALKLVLQEGLSYEPGTSSLYSDLGYYLLTFVLERYFGKSLDTLFNATREVFTLSPRAKLIFRPLNAGIDVEHIAPTSVCEERKVLLRGVVEDENTRALGGVSCVSGLFGNVSGVLSALESLLSSYLGNGPFSQEVVRTFVEFVDEASQYSLGFLRLSHVGSFAFGDGFSQRAIGHLGFTGTSFVVDPERELIVVLLTNRVHPERDNNLIRDFRRSFHKLVAEIF